MALTPSYRAGLSPQAGARSSAVAFGPGGTARPAPSRRRPRRAAQCVAQLGQRHRAADHGKNGIKNHPKSDHGGKETKARRLAPGGVDCSTAASQLQDLLAADPLTPGLERQLLPSASGDGVVMRVAVEGEGEAAARQRLYVPALRGLCGPTQQGGSGGQP